MNITKDDIRNFTLTGEFDIASDVEGLRHTLRFVLNNVPIMDVLNSSLKDKRINKQVQIRAHPEKYPAGVLRVEYTGGRTPVDPETAATNYVAGMTAEQRLEWISAKTGIPLDKLKAMQPPATEPLK